MSEDRRSPDARYGPWKFIHEIKLNDMLEHPVWLWCMQLGLPDEDDGPIGGNETSMRPLLNSDEVPLDHIAPPLILLRVRGTDYHASGLYGSQKKILESIAVFSGRDVSPPYDLADLPEPTIYVAVPAIDGQKGIEFESVSTDADEARQRA
jgi:hypothetical protein